MAGNLQLKYGANNQPITCTITNLANNGQRSSTYVDNTVNQFVDALVFVKVKGGASGTSTSGYVNVYAYGSADGGTTYSENITGADSHATLTNPPNLVRIGVINVVANAATYAAGPFSVAAAFSGTMPDHWGIVIENKTGAALDASVGSAWYQGVYGQYT